MTNSAILQVERLTKTYTSAQKSLTVLHDVTFSVSPGSSCAIIGPSGSGKTTLLGLCAGLDKASSGSVILNGMRLDELNEDELALVRNKHVGFVFQNFQLIQTLTALENVMVPAELRADKSAKAKATALLERVGLLERMDHYPAQLSGGEQQRVALARAFVNCPTVLFVDEPTGNLDVGTSEAVQRLLFELNAEAGTTLIMVTHDLELAERTRRVIRLKGGVLIGDSAELPDRESLTI